MAAGKYKKYCPALAFDLPTQSGICISYNTGTCALPDVYARCPRACSALGRCAYIYQAKHECLCYYVTPLALQKSAQT